MAAREGRSLPAGPIGIHLPGGSGRWREPGIGRNLRDLLDQDRHACPPEAVDSSSCAEGEADTGGNETWRFQAEILRAECNFLRMEREVTRRKLEGDRARQEVALRSEKESLVSGRKKIDGSEGVAPVINEGIGKLGDKMEELKLRSRRSFRKLRRRSFRKNFDHQASVLRRQLEIMKGDTSIKDIREISLPPVSIGENAEQGLEDGSNVTNDLKHSFRFANDMEMLRRKMEGLSRGMLERMEECSHLLSAKIPETIDKAVLHLQHYQVEQGKMVEEKMLNCCNCKVAVGRIMQQVRVESEQWSEMQDMLEQVRVEMEDLQCSRDQWQRRAITSEINFHSQHAQKLEWKQKARSCEREIIELQNNVTELQKEIQSLRIAESLGTGKSQQMSLPESHKEESHIVSFNLKSQDDSLRRSPLQSIDNLSHMSDEDAEYTKFRSM